MENNKYLTFSDHFLKYDNESGSVYRKNGNFSPVEFTESSSDNVYKVYVYGDANATTYNYEVWENEEPDPGGHGILFILQRVNLGTDIIGRKIALVEADEEYVSNKQPTIVSYTENTLTLSETFDSEGAQYGFLYISSEEWNNSKGVLSSSLGFSVKTIGNRSTAEGALNIASGYYSHAEGYLTSAEGSISHAEGSGTRANSTYTHTEGDTCDTSVAYSHVEGSNNHINSDEESSYICGHVEGSFNRADECEHAHVEGYSSHTSEYCHAEGEGCYAYIEDSHAEGYHCTAGPWVSHAEGSGCTSSEYSHAEGCESKALGGYSHAEGYSSQALGDSSHTEGYITKAIGGNSHAEGDLCIASGRSSHAEGYSSQTRGDYSHAEGYRCVASGHSSHAEGYYTQTKNDSESAYGYFNKSNKNSTGQTRCSVGIGLTSSSSSRKNAFEIMSNGRTYIIGLNGYDGTNPTTANTVQQYFNNIDLTTI